MHVQPPPPPGNVLTPATTTVHPVVRFLLSTGNLVGCAGAALVTLLFIVGILKAFWPVLAVAAYGLGVATFWRPTPKAFEEGQDTAYYLDWLRVVGLPKLPDQAGARLARILEMAEEMWPRLKAMQTEGLVPYASREEIKQVLTVFLPELIQNYIRVPPAYARTHKVDGKSMDFLLDAQLELLETHVQSIRDNVYSKDVEALRTNGRVLKEMLDPSMMLR